MLNRLTGGQTPGAVVGCGQVQALPCQLVLLMFCWPSLQQPPSPATAQSAQGMPATSTLTQPPSPNSYPLPSALLAVIAVPLGPTAPTVNCHRRHGAPTAHSSQQPALPTELASLLAIHSFQPPWPAGSSGGDSPGAHVAEKLFAHRPSPI